MVHEADGQKASILRAVCPESHFSVSHVAESCVCRSARPLGAAKKHGFAAGGEEGEPLRFGQNGFVYAASAGSVSLEQLLSQLF